jgi:ketosteroid isomerase-like protein
MEPDEQTLRQLHSTWIDAVNAGDLARLLTLMTDDVWEHYGGKRRFLTRLPN